MSSTTDRSCAAAFACLAFLAAGCGDDTPSEPSNVQSGQSTLADALTSGMRFENGTVRLGDIAEASNASVRLTDSAAVVAIRPGSTSLLPLEVSSSGADDSVDAVLLQFEGADSRIEVHEPADLTSEPLSLSLDYSVDEAVCEGLCDGRLTLTLTQALRLADGEVSEHTTVTVELDCTGRGDPESCPRAPDAGAPDAAVPDAASPDAGSVPDAAPPPDITALAAELSTALAGAHDALCMSCSDASRVPCYAVVPLGAIPCIEGALQAQTSTPELATALGHLITDVDAVSESCTTCDFDVCGPMLLSAALPEFPAEASTAIDACTTPAR